MSRRLIAGAIALAILVSAVILARLAYDIHYEKEVFRGIHRREAEAAAREVQRPLQELYEALRTIARLPGVRTIDRYAENFDGNARQTVQEIYNNLYADIRLSEVYIVPVDLEPDSIDPRTGERQAPITTFDEFIVGTSKDGKGAVEEAAAEPLEEIEIFEYRLMKQQLAWFKAHGPDVAAISGLDYPFLSGPEVITCDNSRYSPKQPNDKDRSGIVFSVPYYGPDGALRGCVSAVLLSSVLGELLPSPNYALLHAEHNYHVLRPEPGQALASEGSIAQNIPDASLIHSMTVPLALKSSDGAWHLWAGEPNSEFWNDSSISTAKWATLFGLGATWGGAVIGIIVINSALLNREKRRLAGTNQALEAEITQRIEAERELIKARQEAEAASRAKSAFLATMSHEIRTPMNGVIGMTQLLMMTELDDVQQRYARTVEVSANSLLGIINDILDFSKIEAGKLDIENIPFDLQRSVEEVIDLVSVRASEKGLEFACIVDHALPRRLLGDPTRVRQVLVNLCGNAIKFTERGEIVVRASLLRATPDSVVARFTVSDTGIGIPEEKRHTLFKSFSQVDGSTTRRYGGTGLGLAISKQLVELMGGVVGVDSVVGKGSTFWFELPLRVAEETATVCEVPHPQKRLSRVLVVDDNAVNREILLEQLRPLGCMVQCAEDGPLGLLALRSAAAAGRPFDLAVLDMMMPDMDGETLGREIKGDPAIAGTHLVMLTSVGLRGDAARAREIGFAAFLTKPAKQSELLNCIHEVMGWQSGGVAGQAAAAKPFITRHALREASGAPLKVLLVEDNDINRELATIALSHAGCSVAHAVNGAEAVAACEAGSFGVILMDCQMPVMDGFEATAAIRAREQENGKVRTPIIALTADAMAGDRERCLAAGMDDYLTKPVQIESMIGKLQQWAGLSGAKAASPAAAEPAEPVATEAPATESPLIAREELLARCMGQASIADRLLAKFALSAEEYLQGLRAAVAAGDFGEVGRIAHKLKGAAAAVAIERLRAAAEDLQQASHEAKAEETAAAVDSVAELFGAVAEELERGKQ